MITKRLKAIADLVPINNSVIDIGTDHAYIPIYLYHNNITKDITATDISSKVLEYSLNNLKKYKIEDKIPLILSDGFKNITNTYNVGIIAGMGTSTIKNILSNSNIPNTLIIQSNNEHYELRRYMQDLGYKIDKEEVVKDKYYYVIIRYKKGIDNLEESELLFGKSNNLEYYNYLIKHYKLIYSKSRDKKYLNYITILQSIIEKIQDCY